MFSTKTDWHKQWMCLKKQKNNLPLFSTIKMLIKQLSKGLPSFLNMYKYSGMTVSAAVHCGGRWQAHGGVLLPRPAEEHPPLHFQEPWPPRPLWSPVAQAEHFCAEQHSVDLHGLQVVGEKADRREGRSRPHRAHAHHHTGGGWTACRRTCRTT